MNIDIESEVKVVQVVACRRKSPIALNGKYLCLHLIENKDPSGTHGAGQSKRQYVKYYGAPWRLVKPIG